MFNGKCNNRYAMSTLDYQDCPYSIDLPSPSDIIHSNPSPISFSPKCSVVVFNSMMSSSQLSYLILTYSSRSLSVSQQHHPVIGSCKCFPASQCRHISENNYQINKSIKKLMWSVDSAWTVNSHWNDPAGGETLSL